DRADGEHPAQRNAGRRRVQRHAQSKVAAQRKAADQQRSFGEAVGNLAHRADHLVDAARMEQVAVQVMGLAVIAEVQAKYVAAFGEQSAAGVQDVARLRAAFPAVQQYRKRARLRQHGLARVKSLQARAAAAIEDVFGRTLLERGAAAPEQPAAHAAGGQRRLQVRTAQPAPRREFAGRVHTSGMPSACAMRSRAATAVWRRPSSLDATGSRKCTLASNEGPPSRRTKLPKKCSPGANGTRKSIVPFSP